MRRVLVLVPLLVVTVLWSRPIAQRTVDEELIARLRTEGTERSQIMRSLHVLTDRFGPRLTGSPNLRAAQDWVVQQATSWGLVNAHLEPWDFGHPGWANDRLAVHMLAPVADALVVEALAWTPGTKGAQRAPATLLELPPSPSKETLTSFLEGTRPQVKGHIVLVGRPQTVGVTITSPARRREDADVRAQFGPESTPSSAPPAATTPPAATPAPLTAAQIGEQLDQFLVAAGAVARVNDAGRDHGQIRAFNNRTFDVTKAVPTVVMRNEDYGRIARLLADGTPVELEVDIVNRTFPEGRTQHNVVAEIAGSDKAGEVVMLGGHLDSWHSATGATDNAIGSSVMLEAIRLLQAVGAKPRRTIRVALWSGEEQGLLGSQAYVREHFGRFEDQKPEYAGFAGYFNIDSGTGRARGLTVFGPPEAATILRTIVAPFADTGLLGATSTTSRRRGGSDHTSFNEAGLPGIGVAQDPIDYQTYTWHTNLDTYERVIESDAKHSAIAIASAVYHLAMREDQLPRLTKEKMPSLTAPTP